MVVCLPIDPFVSIEFKGFSHYVVHLIGPPPSINPLTCHITLVVNLWTLWAFTFFIAPMVGERMTSHDVAWDIFASIVRRMRFHVLHEQNSCSFATYFLVYMSTN